MLPADEKVKLVGAVALHPADPAEGAEALSVIRKPVTPMLSVAEIPDTGTVREADVAGSAKLVTVGAVTSGRVMVTEAVLADETLPAASFTQL